MTAGGDLVLDWAGDLEPRDLNAILTLSDTTAVQTPAYTAPPYAISIPAGSATGAADLTMSSTLPDQPASQCDGPPAGCVVAPTILTERFTVTIAAP